MFQISKLFNIQQQYLQLMIQIEEAEGELSPENEQLLQFTEQRLKSEGAEIGYVIKSWQYMQTTLESEIERLIKMKAKIAMSKELLKNRLSDAMQQFGIERITGDTIAISFRKSEAVAIDNQALIPSHFLDQQQPKVSKDRIKTAIKAGKEVPGASLVQRNNLQIK